MKYLVMVTPGPMPPPLEIIRAAREWLDDKAGDGTFEAVYAFADGGGFSISEAGSHEELMDMLLEYPMSPFVSYDVKALVDSEAAFDRFESYAEKMAEMMAGAAS
jgi:hypothetical protein